MRAFILILVLLIGLSFPYLYYKNKKEVKTSSVFSGSSLSEESFQSSDSFQRKPSDYNSSQNKNPEEKSLENSTLAIYQEEEFFGSQFFEEEEKLNQYFIPADKEEDYSYSESLFAYHRDTFNQNGYDKDQIVYETTELVFVESKQKPEESYQVIRNPAGKLAVFLGSVIITPKNQQWHREKVEDFLKEKSLSYENSPSGNFVIPVSEVSDAFQIKNSLKEIEQQCKKIVLHMQSHFHRPGV